MKFPKLVDDGLLLYYDVQEVGEWCEGFKKWLESECSSKGQLRHRWSDELAKEILEEWLTE